MDFYDPSGRRVREVVETTDRREAQEYHDKLKAELWRVSKLGQKARVPFATAAARWLREKSGKASIRNDALHIRFWRGHYTYLDQVTRENADLAVSHLKEHNGNRYKATLRSILKKAVEEWDMLDKDPKVRVTTETERRIRFLSREEAARLTTCISPKHRPLIQLLFATGLRLGCALSLSWSQVNLERRVCWIHADQIKNRKPLPVPLNDDAIAALKACKGRHPVSVFNQSRPTHTVWKNALKRAGLTDFRIHDCRHTWASWHVQAGTPLYALQESVMDGNDVIEEIAAERKRQIEKEGWTPEHDDEHTSREMARAACAYLKHVIGRAWVYDDKREADYTYEDPPDEWPYEWDESWWKPIAPRRDLVRAAALIVAEIERMDRATPRPDHSG